MTPGELELLDSKTKDVGTGITQDWAGKMAEDKQSNFRCASAKNLGRPVFTTGLRDWLTVGSAWQLEV